MYGSGAASFFRQPAAINKVKKTNGATGVFLRRNAKFGVKNEQLAGKAKSLKVSFMAVGFYSDEAKKISP